MVFSFFFYIIIIIIFFGSFQVRSIVCCIGRLGLQSVEKLVAFFRFCPFLNIFLYNPIMSDRGDAARSALVQGHSLPGLGLRQ